MSSSLKSDVPPVDTTILTCPLPYTPPPSHEKCLKEMLERIADTKSDIDTANENIDKVIDSVNRIKSDIDQIRNYIEALNNRLGICKGRMENLEKDYKPVKTKIDHLTETMSIDEHKETPTQSVKQTKDETMIVLNRLPKKPNMMPQALLTSLHILLGLPIMSLPVVGLDNENTALAIDLGSKENLEKYCKQIKQGLKRLQNSKPTDQELIRVSKLSIEPYLDETLNRVKKQLKSKASEFSQIYKDWK